MSIRYELALFGSALMYARAGLPVIPLHGILNGACTCQNAHCKHPGKHPRIKDWVNRASIDEDVIKDWWDQWPNANVSIATGRACNIVVLDVDPRHGVDKSWKEMIAQNEPLPDTLKCFSGGGGEHYYFDLADANIKNRVNFRPGLDFRAAGGSIVAPPSLHASGNSYGWDQRFCIEIYQNSWFRKTALDPRWDELAKLQTQRSEAVKEIKQNSCKQLHNTTPQ